MKKLLLILPILFISACSHSDKDIDCERAKLISNAMYQGHLAAEENNVDMRNMYVCFISTIYELDNNKLKPILNSEEKKKTLATDIFMSCGSKIINITQPQLEAMAQQAMKAAEFLKQHKSCFE